MAANRTFAASARLPPSQHEAIACPHAMFTHPPCTPPTRCTTRERTQRTAASTSTAPCWTTAPSEWTLTGATSRGGSLGGGAAAGRCAKGGGGRGVCSGGRWGYVWGASVAGRRSRHAWHCAGAECGMHAHKVIVESCACCTWLGCTWQAVLACRPAGVRLSRSASFIIPPFCPFHSFNKLAPSTSFQPMLLSVGA